jgi:cytochrome c oxidase subunit III
VNIQPALDLSSLPEYAYGQRSVLWWATLGFCLIKGTAFALALVGYFYLRGKVNVWPPDNVTPPDLL